MFIYLVSYQQVGRVWLDLKDGQGVIVLVFDVTTLPIHHNNPEGHVSKSWDKQSRKLL